MRVFLTGATGLIGRPLLARLCERGDTPVVLSRNVAAARARLSEKVELIEGDPQLPGAWMQAIDGCQGIINLAGEPVIGRRWNERQKQVLRDSRLLSTQNVARAMAESGSRPAVLVNASAIGYYGNVPEGELTESAPPGTDFLARLCADWEQAAAPAAAAGARVALVRVGVVLAREGGALAQMLMPFKLGLGGPVGAGRQWVSWIHLDDIVGMFLTALDDARASGPINGTAPAPLRNKEFSQALAAALHRPCLFPISAFALKLRFGEVAEVLIGSQRVLPARMTELGFRFQHVDCAEAMRAIFASQKVA